MRNFFKAGSIAFIIILTIIGIVALVGAISTGMWHLWIIVLMAAALATTLFRDLNHKSSNHKSI